MHTWQLAILFKPFLAAAFFGVFVAPFVLLARGALPEGRLKAFLTKDRTTAAAPLRDRVLYGAAIVLMYAALIGYAMLVTGSPST